VSTRLRVAVAAVAGLALLGALVAVGRWEARRHARDENNRIAGIRALVGPLDRPKPDAYRVNVGTGFDCLLWKRNGFPYALELCFTSDGRVVEAIDRRNSRLHIASLREDPGRATTRIDPQLARRLLRGLGAPVA
jgi:4-amino-4-deoxy-L-arabinose transferase-like glycosyltransferase